MLIEVQGISYVFGGQRAGNGNQYLISPLFLLKLLDSSIVSWDLTLVMPKQSTFRARSTKVCFLLAYTMESLCSRVSWKIAATKNHFFVRSFSLNGCIEIPKTVRIVQTLYLLDFTCFEVFILFCNTLSSLRKMKELFGLFPLFWFALIREKKGRKLLRRFYRFHTPTESPKQCQHQIQQSLLSEK